MCSHVCWKLRGQWQIGNGRSLKDFLSTFSLPTSLACDDPVPSSWALLINGLCKFFFSPLVFPPSSTLPNETASAISATTGEFFSRYHDLLIDRYSLVSEIVLPFFFLDGNILVRRVGEVPVGGRRGGRPIFESGFKKKKRKKATSQLNTHKHTGAKT